MFEEAKGKLHAQNAAHRFIHDALGNLAGAHLADDRGAEEVSFHIHVKAGHQGLAGDGCAVWPDGVILQLGDRAPVRNHEAVEAPLLAQNLRQGEWIGGGGHAVDGIERAHHGGNAGLDRSMIGRQVNLAQRLLAHIGGVVVAARNGCTIRGKMLHAGGHGVGLRKIVLLIALDPGARHRRAEVGVFAV